jgi:ubiquinone/menaquinone biosynthesis C-methylase UbiE
MPPSLSDFPGSPSARILAQLSLGLDPRSWRVSNPTEALARGFQGLRSSLFMAESLPLFWLQRPRESLHQAPPPPEALDATLTRLGALLDRDAELIGEGLIPLSVLAPRDPIGHGARLLRILADAVTLSARRRQRRTREFSPRAKRWLDDLPSYYRRNFHYQTDGYLSERSADLYEHQVELLFRGGGDAMRRLILRPLKVALGNTDGRGLRFLELGSGTGIATRFVAMAFPGAKITALDLSYPYMKHAQKQLRNFDRIDFVQGDAAALEFQDHGFDAIYSSFLFHELPLPVREAVLEESMRVLRPGGFFGFVDSLQHGDDDQLDWALDFFPRQFHEPYYTHYLANPMQDLLRKAGFETIESDTGYLSKVVSARTPASSHDSADHSH